MNGQNSQNLLKNPFAIAAGVGLVGWLVGCVVVGVVVDMKDRDQRIALGFGGTASLVTLFFSLAKGERLDEGTEERVVRVELPKASSTPPSTQPFDLPLGRGSYFYIEAISGAPETNPEALVSGFRQQPPAPEVQESYQDDFEPQSQAVYPDEIQDDGYGDVWDETIAALPDLGDSYPTGHRR